MLTTGTIYPHDWGYIPATLGPDGDPVDAFLLGAGGTFPGLVVRASPIGVLQVEQIENGRKFRNDRLLFLPWEPSQSMPFKDVKELRKGEKEAIERFFPARRARDREEASLSGLARSKGGGGGDQAGDGPPSRGAQGRGSESVALPGNCI
jgi:inorganic pyrophosphatase